MSKGICTVSVAPLRADHSHQSEMTSQLLYGETFTILERRTKFIRIQMDYDQYEGWVDVQQITEDSNEILADRCTKIVTEPMVNYNSVHGKFLLSIGSEVTLQYSEEQKALSLENIIETAKLFENVPYLWSGRSFFGCDCSGFVQLVYKVHGIVLPRDAYQQAEVGEVLSFIEEGKPGDLVFFENAEGHISHVGLLLEDQQVMHAFGKVRIDCLDSMGIFNKELGRHTHKLRFLRRVF